MKMKKMFFLLALTAGVACYYACKKKDTTTTTTPTTTATPTCSDGIQNQGETGVDCGGPCGACPTNVCTGNGSATYFPLAVNNQWNYFRDYVSYPDVMDTATITGTTVLGSKTYFRIISTGSTAQYYIREETNGDIYCWNAPISGESLLLPANPTVGQGWKVPYFSVDSFLVKSVNASIISPNGCSYTGLLKIDTYTSGSYWETWYYKKGVGFVHATATGFFASTYYLKSLTLQ